MESILDHVRVAVGVSEEDTAFDNDLMIYINGALGSLTQQGAGNLDFIVKDNTEKWADYLPEDQYKSPILNLVQEYVVLHTKILFDPPPPKTQEFMERKLQENEWRIQTQVSLLEKEGEM